MHDKHHSELTLHGRAAAPLWLQERASARRDGHSEHPCQQLPAPARAAIPTSTYQAAPGLGQALEAAARHTQQSAQAALAASLQGWQQQQQEEEAALQVPGEVQQALFGQYSLWGSGDGGAAPQAGGGVDQLVAQLGSLFSDANAPPQSFLTPPTYTEFLPAGARARWGWREAGRHASWMLVVARRPAWTASNSSSLLHGSAPPSPDPPCIPLLRATLLPQTPRKTRQRRRRRRCGEQSKKWARHTLGTRTTLCLGAVTTWRASCWACCGRAVACPRAGGSEGVEGWRARRACAARGSRPTGLPAPGGGQESAGAAVCLRCLLSFVCVAFEPVPQVVKNLCRMS